MNTVFLKLLNMSIIASYIIAAAVVIRILFKKAPKWINYIIWCMVGIRLILPFSIKSKLSLIPRIDTVPINIVKNYSLQIGNAVPSGEIMGNQTVPAIASSGITGVSAPDFISIAAVIWIAGMALLVIYGILSYLLLLQNVKGAEHKYANIYISKGIASPFIMGIVKPKIYLPYAVDEKNIPHIIAHENAHLTRRDHWIKPFCYLLLSVYWFNPFIWLAYILLCRDIELACDEAVIRKLGEKQKKPYSEALLSCSVKRRTISACPLAFGEIGVKNRIKNVLDYRKPAVWVIITTVVISIILAVAFLTNPKDKNMIDFPEGSYSFEKVIYMIPFSSYYPFEDTGELYNLSEDKFIVTNRETGEVIEEVSFDKLKSHGFTNDEWRELFTFNSGVIDIEAIGNDNRAMWELSDEYRIYIMDGEIWLMRLAGNNGVWNIYKLKPYDPSAEEAVSNGPKFYDHMTNMEYTDSLGKIIPQAIYIANHTSANTGDIAAQAFTILKKEDGPDELVLYVMAMYLEFNNVDGRLIEGSYSHGPAVITLEKGDNGGYGLEEYWTPEDGSRYKISLKNKFPDDFDEDLLDPQIYVKSHLQTCYESAIIQSGIDPYARIEHLIERICQSPAQMSEPWAYVQNHMLEYRELIYYGQYTLRYCFDLFKQGGQTGLEGHLMALVCKEIMENEPSDGELIYSTGQEWYDEVMTILPEWYKSAHD